jgi:hypothetical protein
MFTLSFVSKTMKVEEIGIREGSTNRRKTR